MQNLSKSTKALIGFIILLAAAFIIYIGYTAFMEERIETVEGTNKTFGAVDMPLSNELQALGLENSFVADQIDKDHKLHDYKLDRANKTITYTYYTKKASYGSYFKLKTYSVDEEVFNDTIVPRENTADSGVADMPATYYSGTYYYVSDDYKLPDEVQKAADEGRIVLEKGNTTEDCEISTIQCLYWYNNGVGYCFQAINMSDLDSTSFISSANELWSNATGAGEE